MKMLLCGKASQGVLDYPVFDFLLAQSAPQLGHLRHRDPAIAGGDDYAGALKLLGKLANCLLLLL